MNKRDAVLNLLDSSKPAAYIPAAFFLHFNPVYHRGQAAVDKHLEFFNYTGMDLLKIQYEHGFPHIPEIRHPIDWVKMPFYPLEWYQEPLRVVEGLVKAVKKDALVVLTLYSPFMCAGHTTSGEIITQHIHENPDAVKRGMEVITESLMGFVKECIRLGVDGFYTSTQGGEAGRLRDPALFDACVRPYDLALMDEINRTCSFNILHVCDYALPYHDFSKFISYPGQVVSCGLDLEGGSITSRDAAALFQRPFMGGMERKATISRGTQEQVRAEARAACESAPDRFFLGADCTVLGDTPWDNLRAAIEVAHQFRAA